MWTKMIHFRHFIYAADIRILFQNIINPRIYFECTVFTTYSNIVTVHKSQAKE
jgi:hypothetical protein